jgi:hypothetical protein
MEKKNPKKLAHDPSTFLSSGDSKYNGTFPPSGDNMVHLSLKEFKIITSMFRIALTF